MLFGCFGAHKFYLGQNGPGVILTVAYWVGGLATGGILCVPVALLAFVEGIIFFTKSDEEFQRVYVVGQKAWL